MKGTKSATYPEESRLATTTPIFGGGLARAFPRPRPRARPPLEAGDRGGRDVEGEDRGVRDVGDPSELDFLAFEGDRGVGGLVGPVKQQSRIVKIN